MADSFSYRRSGTCCCEIIDPQGLVVAWTVDAGWAGLIVGLLNCVELNGLTAVAHLKGGHSLVGQKLGGVHRMAHIEIPLDVDSALARSYMRRSKRHYRTNPAGRN